MDLFSDQSDQTRTGQRTDLNLPLVRESAADVYKDLQTMIDRLEKLGEEAVVLWTGSDTVLGTSLTTAFLKREPGLLKRFHQFCQDQRNCQQSADSNAVLDNSEKDTVPDDGIEKENGIPDDGYDADDITDFDDVVVDDDDEDYVPETETKRKSGKRSLINQRPLANHSQTENVDAKLTRLRTGVMTRHSVMKNIRNGGRAVGKAGVKIDINKSEIKEVSTKGSQVFLQTGNVRLIESKEMTMMTPEEVTSKLSNGHSCFECYKPFKSFSRLKEHLTKVHNIRIGYKCKCGKFFHTEKSLNIHNMLSEHFPCEQCKQVFDSKKSLSTHLLETHNVNEEPEETVKLYTCDKCGSSFEFEVFLEMHAKKLPDCDKVLAEEYDMKEALVENITFTKRSENSQDVEVTKTVKEIIADQTKVPFKCVVCDSTYNWKSNYTRHMMTHVLVACFTCNICGLKFKGRESMVRHKKEHLSKPYNCSNCRSRFGDEEELKSHLANVCRGGNNVNLTCDICKYVAASRSALDKHKMKHTGERPFTCQYCNKCVATRSSLERHILAMHRELRPYQCEHCNKTFKTKDTFRKHLKTHSEPRFSCELCGKTCVEMGNLKKHMMTHTKEKPFVCEICGKAYGRKSLMENHRRLHTGEKPFLCGVEGCGKAFRSYSNLKQHDRSHAPTKAYVCDICGKSFKQPGRLNHHRKDHQIDFRWPCAYCDNKYKSLFMYKNHLAKNHADKKRDLEETSNIRLYQCHLCSKMYGDNEDLKRHIHIHLGTKPFKCQYCEKSFNDKSNVKQHEKIHTGDRRHTCRVCRKAFIHKKTLRLHSKACHGINSKTVISKTGDLENDGKRVIDQCVMGEVQNEQIKLTIDNVERDIIIEHTPMLENKKALENVLAVVPERRNKLNTSKAASIRVTLGLMEPLLKLASELCPSKLSQACWSH